MVVTNTVAGNKPTSVTSAVAPVTVNVPEGMRQVKIITSQGRGTGMTLTLKDAAGQPVSIPADTSGDYNVYEFLTAPGVYTYEARDTVRGSEYLLGTGTLTVTEGTGEQTFELYLVYVYAVKSAGRQTTSPPRLKAADGTVMHSRQAPSVRQPMWAIPTSWFPAPTPGPSSPPRPERQRAIRPLGLPARR